MTGMGIPASFVQLVQMLLMDASAAVAINGLCTTEFPIRRGVRQGCPLAPYLFLIVAEALATSTYSAVGTGRLRGITLLDGSTQQVLSQFADDTTYSIRGTKRYLSEVSNLLVDFGHATGLTINRAKCALYWYGQGAPPQWLGIFGCEIAPPRALSKLLGTPFGITLDTDDVDAFLAAKITRKLSYWTTVHLSLAARAVVVNSVLLSSLWYFLSLWCGSKEILSSIRASLRNFLWAGTEEHVRARVRWDDCCAEKLVGGLGLIDPQEALTSLTNKWIVKAMVPGNSPLNILLRHRIGSIQPQDAGSWPRSLHWSLLPRFSAPRGSPLWNHMTQAWRRISPRIEATPPVNADEIQNTNLWWTTQFLGDNFGFTKQRARTLAHRGPQCLRDLWTDNSMIMRPWAELQQKFGMLETEKPLLERYQNRVPHEWSELFCQTAT